MERHIALQRRRLLLVGEDFGHSPVEYHDDLYALTGQSGRTLARIAGEHPLDFYSLTRRTNVVELPEQWKDAALVVRGVASIRELMGRAGQRTILLGAKVAAAFGVADYELCSWYGDVARMPHPSGRNHWWNDPAHVTMAEAFLREALA